MMLYAGDKTISHNYVTLRIVPLLLELMNSCNKLMLISLIFFSFM